jgi:hypothetical protein
MEGAVLAGEALADDLGILSIIADIEPATAPLVLHDLTRSDN